MRLLRSLLLGTKSQSPASPRASRQTGTMHIKQQYHTSPGRRSNHSASCRQPPTYRPCRRPRHLGHQLCSSRTARPCPLPRLPPSARRRDGPPGSSGRRRRQNAGRPSETGRGPAASEQSRLRTADPLGTTLRSASGPGSARGTGPEWQQIAASSAARTWPTRERGGPAVVGRGLGAGAVSLLPSDLLRATASTQRGPGAARRSRAAAAPPRSRVGPTQTRPWRRCPRPSRPRPTPASSTRSGAGRGLGRPPQSAQAGGRLHGLSRRNRRS